MTEADFMTLARQVFEDIGPDSMTTMHVPAYLAPHVVLDERGHFARLTDEGRQLAAEVRTLLREKDSAGDYRDGEWLDRIEARLYKLTGDPRWAPYDPDDGDEDL